MRVIFIKIMGLHRAINMLPLQVAAHIPTVPTQKQDVVAALDNSASVTSCYLCRKMTVTENSVMEEMAKIQNRKKKGRGKLWL